MILYAFFSSVGSLTNAAPNITIPNVGVIVQGVKFIRFVQLSLIGLSSSRKCNKQVIYPHITYCALANKPLAYSRQETAVKCLFTELSNYLVNS